MIRYLLFFLFLHIYIFARTQGQQKTDSLLNLVKSQKQDTSKVQLFLEIGNQYNLINNDSASFFYQKALNLSQKIKSKFFVAKCFYQIGVFNWNQGKYDISKENYLKSLELRKEIKDDKGIADCYHSIGNIHYIYGEFSEALEYYHKSIEIREMIGDEKGLSLSYNNIGAIFYSQGIYDKGIEYFLNSVKIRELLNDEKGIADSYNNIGNIHYALGEFDEALEYLFKSEEIYKELGNTKGLSTNYNNIGLIYIDMKKYDKAHEYLNKALKTFEELDDKNGISACNTNIANIYINQGIYDKVLDYYLRSLKIEKELGDKNGEALAYGNIAGILIKLGKYKEAITSAQKSLNISIEIGVLIQQRQAYKNLSEANDSLRIYKKAYEYNKLYKHINDSMFNIDNNKQMKEMEARYQSEKKQLEIDNLTKDKAIKEIEIARRSEQMQKQRIAIYSLILVFIIIVIFSVLLYRQYNDKKKANILLTRQNEEIHKKNSEITEQYEEIQMQKEEIMVANEEVRKQNDEIIRQSVKLKKAYNELDTKKSLISAQAKHLEKANKELQKLSIVASETDNIVLIMDKNGKFEWVNAAFERYYECTLEKYIKINSDNIIETSTNSNIRKVFDSVIENKKSRSYQSNIVRKDGKIVWLQTTLTPIIDETTNDIIKIIAIDADITKTIDAQDKINKQNILITDSIIYAQTIQQAILPTKQIIDKIFNSFVFFAPKDIVSGDFYWFANFPEDNELIVSVVDCTGHGVPGAFMSMIGNNILHEIVQQKEIRDPAEIISQMDKGVVKRLKQEYTDNVDGMDLIICRIKYNGNKAIIDYCGANRPLVYYSQKTEELIVDKGWCKTVGGVLLSQKQFEYSSRSIEIDKGDILYLFSDGFPSQLNNNFIKYGSRKFNKFLLNIAKLDLGKQAELLEKEFGEYKFKAEQYDDVAVWGIKL